VIERLVPSSSTFSGDIDFVFSLIFWLVGFWFLLSEGVFFWLILRFRKKSPGQKAEYVTGELKSEKRWITIPHLLVLVCDVFIVFFAVKAWYTVKQDLPTAPTQQVVRVEAQQWAWVFTHPGPDGKLDSDDDIRKVNELHVEVDRLYHFQLTSKDVLHSFFIPTVRIKQDVVPGRSIRGWFNATVPGRYELPCAELCGFGHYTMRGFLEVHAPDQYQQWVADRIARAAK